MPTCLHVGLKDRRFFDFLGFQEAFKSSSLIASILYRCLVCLGLQHGAILGAKTAQISKKWVPKNVPGRFLRWICLWTSFWTVLASILGGSGLDLLRCLDDFSSFLAYFGHVFGSWFSLFLVSSSANFAKKIQELAEDKAENPRTCRGQSRDQTPYRRLRETS